MTNILKFPVTRKMNERLAKYLFEELDTKIAAEVKEVHANADREMRRR